MSEDCLFNLQYFANYNTNICSLSNNFYTYNDLSSSACRATLNVEKFISHAKAMDKMAEIKTADGLESIVKGAISRNCRFLICDLAFEQAPTGSSRIKFINENKQLFKSLYLKAFSLVENPGLLIKLASKSFVPTVMIYAFIYRLYKVIK